MRYRCPIVLCTYIVFTYFTHFTAALVEPNFNLLGNYYEITKRSARSSGILGSVAKVASSKNDALLKGSIMNNLSGVNAKKRGGGTRGRPSRGSKGSSSSSKGSRNNLKNMVAPVLQIASQVQPNNPLIKAANSFVNENTGDALGVLMGLASSSKNNKIKRYEKMAVNVAGEFGDERTRNLADQFKKAAGLGDGHQKEGGEQQSERSQEHQTETDHEHAEKSHQQEESDQRSHYSEKNRKAGQSSIQTHNSPEKHTAHKQKKHVPSNHHSMLQDAMRDKSVKHNGLSSKEAEIKKMRQIIASKMYNSAQKLHTNHQSWRGVHKTQQKKKRSRKMYKKIKKSNYRSQNNKPARRMNNRHSKYTEYSKVHSEFSFNDLATNIGVIDS